MITDRAVLARAIAVGLATPDEIRLFERGPEIDELAGLSPAERLEAVVASCASGAPASLPAPRPVEIDGRLVAAPPGFVPRRARPSSPLELDELELELVDAQRDDA